MKYHGRTAHASAYPWEGANALDAAVMAYSNISVLRQQLRPDWKIHGELAAVALLTVTTVYTQLQNIYGFN